MRIACRVTKDRIHTLRICNTDCSSTITMVTRTRLKVTCMRSLPVLLHHRKVTVMNSLMDCSDSLQHCCQGVALQCKQYPSSGSTGVAFPKVVTQAQRHTPTHVTSSEKRYHAQLSNSESGSSSTEGPKQSNMSKELSVYGMKA